MPFCPWALPGIHSPNHSSKNTVNRSRRRCAATWSAVRRISSPRRRQASALLSGVANRSPEFATNLAVLPLLGEEENNNPGTESSRIKWRRTAHHTRGAAHVFVPAKSVRNCSRGGPSWWAEPMGYFSGHAFPSNVPGAARVASTTKPLASVVAEAVDADNPPGRITHRGDCVQRLAGIHYASGEIWNLECWLRTSRAFRGEQC